VWQALLCPDIAQCVELARNGYEDAAHKHQLFLARGWRPLQQPLTPRPEAVSRGADVCGKAEDTGNVSSVAQGVCFEHVWLMLSAALLLAGAGLGPWGVGSFLHS